MNADARRLGVTAGLALVVAAGIVPSCGQGDSVVLVNVASNVTLPAFVRLRAVVSNGTTSDQALFPQAPAEPINLPTAFTLTLPPGRSGFLDIAVDALDSAAAVVANGDSIVLLKPGERVDVTITLVGGASLCGNGRIDNGEACDDGVDGQRKATGSCTIRCARPMTGTGGAGAGGSGAGAGGAGVAGTSGGTGGAGMGTGGRGGSGAGGNTGTGGKTGTGGTTGAGGATGTGGRGAGGMTGSGGGPGMGGNTGMGGICSTNLLANGNFASGQTAWTLTSAVNQNVIYSGSDPLLGGATQPSPNVVVLGRNLTSGEEILSQQFRVPANASTIQPMGLFRVIVNPATTCMSCNAGYVEILSNGQILNIASWTALNNTTTSSWPGFSTTLDVSLLRNQTLTYRLRVSASASPATLYAFAVLSLVADRCD